MNKKQARKRPFYKKKRFIIPFLFFAFIFVVSQVSPVEYTGPYGTPQSNPTPEAPQSKLIDDVAQYSRITESELKAIMGEPISVEAWSNKTSYGKVQLKTLAYDTDKAHYEFIVADNLVVRATLYSFQYWIGTDIPFTYNDEIEEIYEMFNIQLDDNARVQNNNINYIIRPANDKIAEVKVTDIDIENKTFGLIKITYNQRYFN